MSAVPAYKLTIGGKLVDLGDRLIRLTLTDNKGLESDQLDIEIDDADGAVEMPRRGVKLSLALGWADEPMTDKGTFIVGEVEHLGAPDRITIRARGADLRASLRRQKEKSWHDTTIEQVVTALASANGLKPVISRLLAKVAIPHMDQMNESDIAFATRLAREHGAVATVKAGKLLFFPSGRGMTATGKKIPPVFIDRSDGDQHRFIESDSNAFSGVYASWQDKRTGKKTRILVGKSDNAKTLRHVYVSEANAKRAANAELRKVTTEGSQLEIMLALGRPDLFPEMPAIFSGWKSAISDISWIINRLTHTLDDGGLTTRVEATANIGSGSGGSLVGAKAVRACWIDRVSKATVCGVAGSGSTIETLPKVFGSEVAARRAALVAIGAKGSRWVLERSEPASLPAFIPPTTTADPTRERDTQQAGIFYQLSEWLGVQW